jgi:Fungal specific transcription factor domain
MLLIKVEPFTQPSRFPALPDDTYVLLVDGVPSSSYNPAFDWSRHLAPNVPLDRPTHDKFVLTLQLTSPITYDMFHRALDLLFKFFSSWCLRIIPDLFLRDMYRSLNVPPTQTPPKTPHYSPMLHNALVALALAFSDGPFKELKTRQYYATHAKSFIEDECRKPNLSVVHALSVLASFHSSQGDQTLGYMYFGMTFPLL